MEKDREVLITEVESLPVVREPALQMIPFQQLKTRFDGIRKIIQEYFVDGVHWGKIPGTDKPTLFKPGSDLIQALFQLRPEFEISRETLEGLHREVTVYTTLYANDRKVGQGVGCGSTMETKYRWRKAERVCPSCGMNTIIKGKEQYGGGWLCWQKKGGCGAKFEDGDPQITGQEVGRVENPDIADAYNTVLKMAKKRSLNDAIITTTGISDMVTQDLDDDDVVRAAGIDSEAPAKPKAKAALKKSPPKDNSTHYYAIEKLELENQPRAKEYLESITSRAQYQPNFDAWATIGPLPKLARAEITEDELGSRVFKQEPQPEPEQPSLI